MPATNVAWGGATLTVLANGADVSCDLLEARIDRSKNRLWDPPDAGTAQIVLDLGPTGTGSTAGPIGGPLTVRIAYAAVTRMLFTGTVKRRRLETTPDGD